MPDELVYFHLLCISAGFDDSEVGRTNSFVGFLSGGVFGLELADLMVLLSIRGFDVISSCGYGLSGEVGAVGTHIGDATTFVESLRELHGLFDAVAQSA